MLRHLVDIALAFVALYPVVTAAVWVAGGLLYRVLDEANDGAEPEGGWPPVTILIPAYNEEAVIATSVRAAMAVDYPGLEIVVLDDGSTDDTVAVASAAAADDPRVEVVPDAVNRGKAERLNLGFHRASNELVVVTDADTHLHPLAIRLLVARLLRSPRFVAVAGAPHVTNRENLVCSLQVLEAASIIGLIRRTQAVARGVGTVAGVLGLFRRDAVIAVGGYDGRMATEDIDLSWRLLRAGWHTVYEPNALLGMEVPSNLRALWAQRARWARGQGEVLHSHVPQVARWRNRSMWPLVLETLASPIWVLALAVSFALTVLSIVTGHSPHILAYSLARGIAVALIAMFQLSFALGIDARYDPRALFWFLLGPLYTLAYWLLSGTAALRAELPALLKGPGERRVVWNIPREGIEGEQVVENPRRTV
jgi:biofilm PGA synthesis N-glycosyltransferase PgaC